MAITKERKVEIIEQHETWLKESKAVVLTEYIGLSAKELEQFRLKVRDAGGEVHVVKNTLGKLVFEKAGLNLPEETYEGSTAISYAFENAPDVAKAITDFAKTSEFIKVKVGVLGADVISAAEVRALADLPPLPVLRAQILGTIMAPATRLARVLAEPGRQIAAVVKAYADQEGAQASA
ncbi:MAG: 50S ribosomal protein L10 [Anaerolineales bacterium]